MNNSLKPESCKILSALPSLINKTFPIPGKFRSRLPSDIAELSHLLTVNRGDRSLSYLSRPNFLSAYLHYFLPWNILRLCILLPELDLKLSEGDVITDFGCGPLTFISALWITRPDLRNVRMEINCVDRASPVLEAGKKFFTALSASLETSASNENPLNWKINLIRKDFNIDKGGDNRHQNNNVSRFQGSSLVCAVNVFNEMYDRISHNNTDELRRMAEKAALFLHKEAKTDASILTIEPGVPQSGRFISFMRETFIELGRMPASPCTHSADCPLSHNKRQTGGVKNLSKEKWCHFAFNAADAPNDLKRLSLAAKLPKERLVFSYLLTGSNQQRNSADIRVLSDAFPLPYNKFGRYACSSDGLVLLSGEKYNIEKIESLYLAENTIGDSYDSGLKKNKKNASLYFAPNGECDDKSGALIIEVT